MRPIVVNVAAGRTPPRPWVSRTVAAFTALALGGVSSGCLSHEYQVSRTELSRLAQLPPEARGQQVEVVQKLGTRRAPAINPNAPAGPGGGPPGYPGERGYGNDGHVHTGVYVGIGGTFGGGGRRGRDYRGDGGGYRGGRGGVAVAQPVGPGVGAAPAAAMPAQAAPSMAQSGGALGMAAGNAPGAAQPVAGSSSPARAMAAAAQPVAGGAPAPAPTGSVSDAAKRGGSKDDLAVMAAIAVAVAAFAVVGMAFTEGARFDGQAAVSPQQLVYLQAGGAERPVPLALLTEADLSGVEHGLLRDDEGYGLVPLQRAPLNRKGFAFKFDAGLMSSTDASLFDGFASHIGLGYFPHRRFGILAGLTLGAFQDRDGNSQPRHSATAEAQFFPLNWRRLHIGAAGLVGTTLRSGESSVGSQLTYGGAALVEIAITTRLAFTLRGDLTSYGATADDRQTNRSLALGLAIY